MKVTPVGVEFVYTDRRIDGTDGPNEVNLYFSRHTMKAPKYITRGTLDSYYRLDFSLCLVLYPCLSQQYCPNILVVDFLLQLFPTFVLKCNTLFVLLSL